MHTLLGTLPGSVYLILKYSEGDYANPYQAAVQANAEVGGDSASRAIAIGMVLGAHQVWSYVRRLKSCPYGILVNQTSYVCFSCGVDPC